MFLAWTDAEYSREQTTSRQQVSISESFGAISQYVRMKQLRMVISANF
jgi:hypothetical protein